MPAPNVTLFLEGMILLFFEDFAGGTAKSCQVGILRNAPGHNFEIRVSKVGDDKEAVYEEEDIRFTLALEVNDPTPSAISFMDWKENFDRLKDTATAESFNWVLDLEREIYPNKKHGIGANRNQFRSLLHLTTGEFSTARDEKLTGNPGISLNDLLTCDEQGNPKQVIGKVATRVGVKITLDADSTAKFCNGKEVLFEAGSADEYVVYINRIRPPDVIDAAHREMDAAHAASHHNRDANNFYNAVGHELGSAEKLYFVSTTPVVATAPVALPPAGPEAACLVAMMSRSEL
jgi:hypothetical protein